MTRKATERGARLAAEDFGVQFWDLDQHMRHLEPVQVEIADDMEPEEMVRQTVSRLYRLAAKLEADTNLEGAVKASTALLKAADTLGKLTGKIGSAVTVNIGIQTLIQQHGVSEEELRGLLEDRKRWASMSESEQDAALAAELAARRGK